MRFISYAFPLYALLFIITAAPYAYSQEQWIELSPTLIEGRFLGNMVLLQDGRVLLVGGKTSSLVITSSSEIFSPLTNTVVSAGNMATPRCMMKSVLLNNGKVLVIGGYNFSSNTGLSSCELYDPITNTWSQTGSMLSSRSRFTATLLKDGRVLVTGGNNGTPMNSCEIYNPTTEIWSAVPSLPSSRNSHAAALLSDGNVLVTDGYSGISRTCSIFNPTTNSWTSTGRLQTRGSGDHTLSLLPDNRLLLTGGWPAALSRSEVYDISTHVWTGTQSLRYKRAVHAALLLPNGRVLVAGGIDSYYGDQSEFSLASTELFSPITESWTEGPSLPIAMDGFGACVLPNGKVLFAGGGQKTYSSYFNPQLFLNKIFTWQDVHPAWLPTDTLSVGRTGHTLTSLPNNKVLSVGGSSTCTDGQALNSCELYNFTTQSWEPGASLQQARSLHTATLLPDGRAVITGGRNGIEAVSSVEEYDFTADVWTQTDSLSTARFRHTATLLMNGDLLVIGGTEGSNSNEQQWPGIATCEVYKSASRQWETVASMNTGRFGHTATLLPNGNILVIGGYNTYNDYLSSVELYNPSLNIWTTVASLTSARVFHTATLLSTGEVLVVGGRNANGTIGTAEKYDYRTNLWSSAGTIPQARFHHTTSLLHNGDVLIAGGVSLSGSGLLPVETTAIYNPSVNTWILTDSLYTSKAASQSTLLPDNTILVTGGYTSTSCTVSGVCFIYNPGLGYQQADRPVITDISPKKLDNILGSGYITLTIHGTGFQGKSETGNTNVYGTATNYPIIEIRRIGGNRYDNDFVHYIPFNVGNFQWSDTVTQVRIEKKSLDDQSLPSGYYRLSVLVNGISSLPTYFSITPSSHVLNSYTAVTDIANSSTVPYLSVEDIDNFAPEDKVLIIQMQGASIDTTESPAYGSLLSLNQAGNYEFSRIQSVDGNTIVLTAPLKLPYDVQGKCQLPYLSDH